MSLSGQWRKQLQSALIDAFPTMASLERMLSFELDKNLRVIAGEGSLEDIVFKLIQAADSQEWVEDLVRAARKENPGNSQLEIIASTFNLSSTSSVNISAPSAQSQQPQRILISAANPIGTSQPPTQNNDIKSEPDRENNSRKKPDKFAASLQAIIDDNTITLDYCSRKIFDLTNLIMGPVDLKIKINDKDELNKRVHVGKHELSRKFYCKKFGRYRQADITVDITLLEVKYFLKVDGKECEFLRSY